MTKKIEDLIAGVILFLVSVIVFIFSNRIPRLVVTTVGPDFMPKLVAVGMGVFSILLIVKSVQTPAAETDKKQKETVPTSLLGFIRQHIDLVTIALLFIYAIGIATVGFLLATCVYLFVHINLMSLNTKQNRIVALFASMVISVGVYLLFTRVLFVMLPSGILG